MADTGNENMVVAQRMLEKFEFYVLALTFTVLGLSVQTANFGRNLVADGLEVLSWLLLLSSGIVGLRRLEQLPNMYRLFHFRQDRQASAQALKKMAMQGARMVHILEEGARRPSTEVIAEIEAASKRIDEELAPMERGAATLYSWQRGLGLSAFVLLIAARAYFPVARIALAIYRGHP
jgi:hypothetical protein